MSDTHSIEDEWHALMFAVRRSVWYHNRRVKFFDGVRKCISVLVMLSGFGTIATLLSSMGDHAVMIAAALASIMSTIDLVFDPAGHARVHDDLKRRFIELEANIIAKSQNKRNLVSLTSIRLGIESDEPQPLRVLDVICHNELLRSMGYDKDEYKEEYKTVTWTQRVCANFFDFRAHNIS